MREASGRTPRHGMVVDLNRCVGCQTCTISCKQVNDTPPGVQWRRVLDVERGEFPDVERLFLVVGCQHCANPPCVPVCPTGATRSREDGLVTMDYDRCIGCGYCAVACPYQARTIVHDQRWYFGSKTRQEAAVTHPERIGVASKCTFCIEKIDSAEAAGKTPGVDLDVTPACAASCITQAIKFGDFNDPESEVSTLARENAFFRMHAELGTDPQIRYLYEVPASTPGYEAPPEDSDDDRLRDPANPLVGPLQRFWDSRAAMNFTLGGMSSGLAVVAGLVFGLGIIPAQTALRAETVAAIGMALGLASVFLEIGRKPRFLFVLLRPQSSWMTRETYAVAVFYPVVALAQWHPAPVWIELAGLSGAVFLLCQARILYAGKGIPAWRAPAVPWLLGATGLLEGTALMVLVVGMSTGTLVLPGALPFSGVLASMLTFVIWRRYCERARAAGLGPAARDVLRTLDPWLTWGSYMFGGSLFALGWAGGVTEGWGPLACLLGAVVVLAGGVALKMSLVTRASFHQNFEIPRLPRRGSGRRAAPARFDPGAARVA